MANLAILTSGNGSNFQAITEAVKNTEHKVVCMVCNRKEAYSFKRAENLGIRSYYVSYLNRDISDVEEKMASILHSEKADLIALAGFMKILSPKFIDKFSNKIINIHPSLLPKYPGANSIEESFNSGDKKLGITIHYVDYGMDTGKIIFQDSFVKDDNDTLERVEEKIHKLEHKNYPKILLNLLDREDKK